MIGYCFTYWACLFCVAFGHFLVSSKSFLFSFTYPMFQSTPWLMLFKQFKESKLLKHSPPPPLPSSCPLKWHSIYSWMCRCIGRLSVYWLPNQRCLRLLSHSRHLHSPSPHPVFHDKESQFFKSHVPPFLIGAFWRLGLSGESRSQLKVVLQYL